MDDNTKWFDEFNSSELQKKLKTNPIAYFCAEYALSSGIPIYAGGLGVLAGDIVREANDRHLPLVAVGLYYYDGYETLHKLDEKGSIEAPHVHQPPQNFGLEPVLNKDGKTLTITVPIEGRNVTARAWSWKVGSVTVFLLDTDCEENTPEDRKITDHLYVIDRQMRLKQEIILGIGGVRMLQALEIAPSLYHMNDGHPSLLSYEVIGQYMKEDKMSFADAAKKVRERIVFSNHTLVTGGQEIFNNDLMSLLLSGYAEELGVRWDQFLSLGKVQDANSFALSALSLQVAGVTNAVSKIHAEYAKGIWPNYNLIPITNGIHVPSWNCISDESKLWESHQENKRELLEKIKNLTEDAWDENTLLLGWARRVVPYKRPMALLEDIVALKEILKDEKKQFRMVFSGRLHPSDTEGFEMLTEIRKIMDTDLKGIAVFLPEYTVETAKLLVAGCDIWVNTPIVGFEACGTSGMKAALNGGLPLSTRDGWMAEVEFLGKGWALSDDHVNQSILEKLQGNDLFPLYYTRNEKGVPEGWLTNMKNSRDLIKHEFSATRMLRGYVEKLYSPLLSA